MHAVHGVYSRGGATGLAWGRRGATWQAWGTRALRALRRLVREDDMPISIFVPGAGVPKGHVRKDNLLSVVCATWGVHRMYSQLRPLRNCRIKKG